MPTLYGVLNSKARPRLFTRSFRTDQEAYDDKHVGWKVRHIDRRPGGLRRSTRDGTTTRRSRAAPTPGTPTATS
ncbi:MAG: hypothetical protein U0797_09430 [Gemmataceae bacterium]